MQAQRISLLVLIITIFLSGISIANPDSLLALIPSANDTTKINLYNELYGYYQDKDTKKSLEYVNKSIEIAKRIDNKIELGQVLIFKGNIYDRRGSFDKAILHFNEALSIYIEIDKRNGISTAYSSLGSAYVDKGDYFEALKYCLKALKISEESGKKNEQARIYNNIGLIHYYQADYQKSLDYYNKSLEIRIELDNKEGIALAYNNIGISYFFLDNLDMVLEYFFKSLKIYQSLNDLRGQVRPLYNIAEIYYEQEKYNDAIEYYNKSLNIDIQLGDTSSFAETYVSIGTIYLKLGQITKALKYQEMALTIMELTDYKYGLMETHKALSLTYEELGNYSFALDHYKIYKQFDDSIYSDEKAKALAEIETKYETEKKEEEIILLNNEKRLQEIELKQQKEKSKRKNLYLIIFGTGFIVLLVFSYTLMRLLKHNKEKTNLLSERNHEINQQSEEIRAALNTINDQKEELLKTNEDLIETTRAKEIFLANTSHEIRTPVNIISGFTNLLLNTKISKVQSRYLKNINNSAQNLLVVINDILTFSKIEAGKLSIESINFNFREVIDNYFESIGITADAKKLNLSYDIDSAIPESLSGDPVRLQQIISNLVGNAIKFTPKGGKIDTQIIKLKENKNEISIKFTVSDNGIGIEEDKFERIFESFTQADKATTRKYGGTGLGLSIVKKLVQLQNGEIKVESIPGKGSSFTFVIPYLTSDAVQKPKTNVALLHQATTKNIKVLIADDNPVNIELLRDIFEEYDNTIKIVTVDNGQSAINKLKNEHFHILLLDIQMPVMDGFKTAAYIRKNLSEPAKNIPIIALSAFADEAQKENCLKKGMNGYLSKPFESQQLFEKITSLIDIVPKQGNQDINET